ncbi:SERINE/THREONINE-PROTEIN KINASE TNNI3K-RELATED [Salix koriyanagi]|uniref:non-specific serine/threonine protein kinase n=1 Tax=Salix koriyanagi TaxID=2511006 RepID=A0A9Q0QKZ2_9ROSI|nr:SERINE/THREONINE-PROTEIN KINASE TNNI3K-RELATED [Salix koriyanagi]
MEDTESCSSRAVDFVPRNQRQKLDVFNDVLFRLIESNDKEATRPGFEDELWTHFCRLPTRYAMDVNAERAQDVTMHKRLLQMARNPATRPAIEVRLVQVPFAYDGQSSDSVGSDSPRKFQLQYLDYLKKHRIHPPPAFGSLTDFELLHKYQNDDITAITRLMHEITISTNDKPKLLSQLTSLLSEIGLNIQEAHAFSTVDSYSLDVFVVSNWEPEDTELLRSMLVKEIPKIEKKAQSESHAVYPVVEQDQIGTSLVSNHMNIPADSIDVWEIDAYQLLFEKKIATGSSGDLYKGTFCSQDVAIKVLRGEHLDDKLQREFSQEVLIMRKVRHKNIVQFIGSCTRPPSLCIVTEFMSGGSMYDFLHKQKGSLNLQSLLRVAIDVSKGMNCLHQNHIIHRDLKSANLLMDENGVSGSILQYLIHNLVHVPVFVLALLSSETASGLFSSILDITLYLLCQLTLILHSFLIDASTFPVSLRTKSCFKLKGCKS